MAETALRMAAGDAGARAAVWRQLADILAQGAHDLSDAKRAAVVAKLVDWRDAVPAAERRAASAAMAGRRPSPQALRLFALDAPAVAAPALSAARASTETWLRLIPELPPSSRALLRNRRDLGPEVERALASFGASDWALPASDDPAGAQIRELVARIEAFRSRQPAPDAATLARAVEFAFETDAQGLIDWVEGAPREALIGIGLAEAAAPGEAGVDGVVAGAFRRRAPFSRARLLVAGEGPAGGPWRLDAAPIFAPADGRFAGYRGQARRPRPEEDAAPARALPADSLRQLVHELRTPLGAIQGFAEMVERQLLGPVSDPYRQRAAAIVNDARRLVALIEDLDQAARTRPTLGDAPPAGLALEVARHSEALAARGAALAVDGDPALLDDPAIERPVARLLGAAAGLARPGEALRLEMARQGHRTLVALSRPVALAGLDAAALLDPGFDPPAGAEEAPMLGVGFTLRLIANLAREAGGGLGIEPERFTLALPAAARYPAPDRGAGL